MKYFLRIFGCAVILLANASGYCATPIYEVKSADGTFIQVPLTHELFRYTSAPRLENLVVLDATESPLPYRVVAIAPESLKAADNVVTESLPYFPIAPDAPAETLRKLHTTQINTGGGKTQILTTDKELKKDTPDFYLIDVSKTDRDLSGIGVDWVAQANNQYLEVELEATRDSSNWFSLATATLININQDGENLTRNIISANIHKNDVEFVRLKILRGADNLIINRVFGEVRTEQRVENPVQETWNLKGEVSKNQTTVYLPSSHSKSIAVAAWEFLRDEGTPVESVAIDLGKISYAGGIKVFSRASENDNWTLRHQGIWFNTQIGDKWEKSNPVSVYQVRDKLWRVELNDSMRSSDAPFVVLGWQPYQLQIITNNKSPYRLAISPDEKPFENRDQVFSQILSATNPQWVQASLTSLKVSPSELQESGKTDWKQWLFWLALILAVGVLLAFSLKLFKQLNSTKTE